MIGSDAPAAFYLGRYPNKKLDEIDPKLQMPGAQPIIIIGSGRRGKDTGIGNCNTLRLSQREWHLNAGSRSI